MCRPVEPPHRTNRSGTLRIYACGVWSRPQNASRSDGLPRRVASRERCVHAECKLAETGNPDLNKREPGRPERGRSGECTPCPLYEVRLFCVMVYQSSLVHSTRPPGWDFDHATHDSSLNVGLLPTTPAHHSVGRLQSVLSRERRRRTNTPPVERTHHFFE